MGQAVGNHPESGMSAQPFIQYVRRAGRRMNATTITPGRPDMTADTFPGAALPKPPSMSRLIVAATIGNVFEWFDFVVYGFFAVTLAEVFFPTGNPTVSLLVAFGAFGLAYVVRPLGAIVVGGYTDRAGRKAGLLLSLALMMIGTTMMPVAPGGADHHHARAALAGIFGRRRIRQRRHVPRRAWRRTPRVQRQLAICHRRHHHGARLDLRRYPDDVIGPPAIGRLGMADPLFLRHADRAGRSLCPLASRPHAGIHRSREARDDPDQRPAAAASAAGIAGARHLDHLEQLLLPDALHSDLRGEAIAFAGIYRVCRNPGRRPHPGDRLPARRPLVRQDVAPADHGDHVRAVRADLLPGLLPDGRMAVAGGLHRRRRVAASGQGRLQRRSAVAVVRAIPGGNAGNWRVFGFQHRRDDLRRFRAFRRALADRTDPQRAVAEFIPDLHRAAQPQRADRDPAAQPPARPNPGTRRERRARRAMRCHP